MKFLVSVILFLLAFNLSANTLVIKANNLDSITLTDGSYVKVADLQDGIDSVEGIESQANLLKIQNVKSNIESFQFSNGRILHVNAAVRSGGDMGGGGL